MCLAIIVLAKTQSSLKQLTPKKVTLNPFLQVNNHKDNGPFDVSCG